MQKNICLLILLIIGVPSVFSTGKKPSFSFPLSIPVDSVALFSLPSEISNFPVRDFALSPNKEEIFFTVESPKSTFSSIIRMNKVGNKWVTEVAPFSGQYSDIEPVFSPDGQTLYFVSNRPLNNEGTAKDFDIWKTEKKNGAWQQPVNLGAPVNTEANEFYPAITNSGNLYYTAEYENSKGKEDIWVSRFVDGKYTTPESLSDSVNSSKYEFNAYVSPDESLILFTSFGREDDMGGGDLYISQKDKAGNWTKAKNLGEKINSTALDFCPFISFDKQFFVFTSNRSSIRKSYKSKLTLNELVKEFGQPRNGKGNLYWIGTKAILE